MNVVPLTFVSPRSCFSVTTFETQSDDASIMTSAGYSQGAGPVNASDRPQTDAGHSSSGVTPQAIQAPAETLASAGMPTQRHCFRLDLTSPYGHVFV